MTCYSSRLLDGKFRVEEDSSLRDDGSRADGARIRNRMATSFTVGTELSGTNYRRALEVRGKSDIVLIEVEIRGISEKYA